MIDVSDDGHVTNVLLLVHQGTDFGYGKVDLAKVDKYNISAQLVFKWKATGQKRLDHGIGLKVD